MYVRAGGVGTGFWSGPRGGSHLHVKSERQFLGGVAGVVVTSLIFQFPVDRISSGRGHRGRYNHSADNEITGIDAQLGAGIEREAHELAGRVLHFAQGNFSGEREMQLRGDQLFRQRLTGINVIGVLHVKGELNRG